MDIDNAALGGALSALRRGDMDRRPFLSAAMSAGVGYAVANALGLAGGPAWATSTRCLAEDALSVVDPKLRVYGVEGLRVADASVMPTITTCNTNAPSMLIGWRAAKMIAVAA